MPHQTPLEQARQPGRLALRTDGGIPRYFLYDTRVDAGDHLEVQLANGRWLRVRYEGVWQLGGPRAGFTLDLNGAFREPVHDNEATVLLPSKVLLRWAEDPARDDVWDPWRPWHDDDEDQAAGSLVADDVDADRRQAELDKHAQAEA